MRILLLLALLALPLAGAEHLLQDYGATVTLDRAVYRSGDTMTITFHNGGDEVVYFIERQPWEVRDASGLVPLKSDSQSGGTQGDIKPGGTVNMTWDLGGGGHLWPGEIPPGDYAVVVKFGPPDRYPLFELPQEVSAPFRACTTPRDGAEGHADRAFLVLYCGDAEPPALLPPG